MTQAMDLVRLVEDFGSEDKCRKYLEELRWPNGMVCPRCEGTIISRIRQRNQFECDGCNYQFSVTSRSVFHGSHLPLWKWFLATYLMCEARKGVSANQIKRTLGISYKTAWYLCHRIRSAMREACPTPLSGVVEMDETLVGGKVRGRGRGYRGNKTTVIGAAERSGDTRLKVDKSNDRETLRAFLEQYVAADAEAVYTDEWPAYRGIVNDDTRHETVNHSQDEWVRGDVHTNTVEGVWGLFKRSVVGSYHKLSIEHLPAYLSEMEWRFNNRHNPMLFKHTMERLVAAEPLTYAQLIEKEKAA